MKSPEIEIVDHRVKASRYTLPYISCEIIRDPDTGAPVRVGGQPKTRPIREMHERTTLRYLFTVDVSGERIEFMPEAEIANRFGKRKFNRALRAYMTKLRAEQEKLPEEVCGE